MSDIFSESDFIISILCTLPQIQIREQRRTLHGPDAGFRQAVHQLLNPQIFARLGFLLRGKFDVQIVVAIHFGGGQPRLTTSVLQLKKLLLVVGAHVRKSQFVSEPSKHSLIGIPQFTVARPHWNIR